MGRVNFWGVILAALCTKRVQTFVDDFRVSDPDLDSVRTNPLQVQSSAAKLE